jgi:tetratricopeptide (TPR) repeat protein
LDAIGEAIRQEGSRLCVVTGTAGVGKTAAALAAAYRHRADFPDGQIFVDLRGFSDDPPVEPIDALAACLRSLGIDNAGMPPTLAERSALFRSLVAERRVLVLLDNAHSSAQARPLLPGGPSCAVVITSRETLPGLGARDGARVVGLTPLTPNDADRLLVTLAGARAEHETAATSAIARLCGELPLALRIVAQRILSRPDLSLADVESEIADGSRGLDLLDAGDGPATDIRAVMSWSYESLSPEVARVFRLLGLLPGADADHAALEALCDCGQRVLRSHLDVLVRAHLVERSADGRYRQHDLLHAYAAEVAQRDDTPREQVAARSRLMRFYARAAAAAHAVLRPDEREELDSFPEDDPGVHFSDISSAQSWLDRERGNVLACVEAAEPADAAQVFALSPAYTPRCRATGRHVRDDGQDAVGLRLNIRQLDLARSVGDVAAEHAARMGLGACKANFGDLDGAEAEFSTAVALAAENGDEVRKAAAVGNLGTVAADRGYLARAVACFTEAVEVFRRHEARSGEVTALLHLGCCRLRAADRAEAQRHLDEALRICDEEDLPRQRVDVLIGLADAALAAEDPDRAERHAEAAEELALGLGAYGAAADARSALAQARMAKGLADEAQQLFRAAVPQARRLGNVPVMVSVLRRYVAATAEAEVATTMHREVLGYVAAHGFRGIEAELRVSFAGVHEEWGDAAAAVAELHRAHEIYLGLEDRRASDVATRLAGLTTARSPV